MKRSPIRIETQKKMNASGYIPCDICGEKNILVVHHISGRKIPFYNSPSNKSNICPNCHIKVHEGLIIIEGWAKSTNGKILLWHYYKDNPISEKSSCPHIIKRKI